MLKNVLISNEDELERIKLQIKKDGISKLHILADFDKTLTKAFTDGKKITSVIAVLRDENYLSENYSKKAHKLYEKYHPIEINPKIPLNEKKKAMYEWWKTHFDLLIKEKLNKKDIEKVVNSGKIELRDGSSNFIEFLHENNVPLIILSSAGLGHEAVAMYLRKQKLLYENVNIISNEFIWDKNGYALNVKEPIIHAMNKDETLVKNFSFFNKIKDRKNVILLGDNIEDVGMIKGFDYDNLLKIGFLNENVKENLEYYKKAYDILILDDDNMNYVNDLLKSIFS